MDRAMLTRDADSTGHQTVRRHDIPKDRSSSPLSSPPAAIITTTTAACCNMSKLLTLLAPHTASACPNPAGVALGVSLNKTDVTVLLIVLIFHQGLEGVGLGSTLVRAGFSNLKCLIMVLTYAIMTPLGVAIGIAAAGSYDPKSVTSLAVQGTLNSVSAGLLMYIALAQLIAEDFNREEVHRPGAGLLRASMFGALLIGVGAMAVIGIWA